MSNRASKIVGAGTPPLAASMISGDVQNTVSAAGTTQGTATSVYGDNVIVTTVAAGTGIVLGGPGFGPGDDVVVSNKGANPLLVYPPVGAQFNGLGANNPVTVQRGQLMSFFCIGTDFVINSATIDTALTATGNSQGTALALVSQFNQVGTTAASTGVILTQTGGLVYIFNGGANTLSVYPPTGGTVNGAAANAAASLPTLKGMLLWVNGINSYSVAGV